MSFWKFGFQESPENEAEVEANFVRVEAMASKLYNDNNPSQGIVRPIFLSPTLDEGRGRGRGKTRCKGKGKGKGKEEV